MAGAGSSMSMSACPSGAERRAAPAASPCPPARTLDARRMTIWPHLVREASGALLIGVVRHPDRGLFRRRRERDAPGPVPAAARRGGSDRGADRPDQLWGDDPRLLLRGGVSAAAAPATTNMSCPDARPRAGRRFRPASPRFGDGRAQLSARRPRRARRKGAAFVAADLVWERDPACSYRRSFAFDAASGRYAPDRPLPECSTYSLP